MGMAYPGPALGGAAQSPLGTGRVCIVDLGEVGSARKLDLRRWSRRGEAQGFAGNSEVVQNLAYRFRLGDRDQDLHAPLALGACQPTVGDVPAVILRCHTARRSDRLPWGLEFGESDFLFANLGHNLQAPAKGTNVASQG
jgi:hypothetical protein